MINEIFADGSGTEWFELYNPSDQPINLGGVWLSNSEDTLAMQALPANTTIAAESFLQLRKGVDFSFSMKTGTSTGHIFLTTPSQNYVLTGYCFGPQHAGWSIGRYPDGAEDWHYMDSPTPGTANTRHRLSQVVINEIMYHSPAGDNADYVELRNTGTTAVDISNWEFAGIGYRFADQTTLAAGAYAVVCDDKSTAAQTYGLNVNTLFGGYNGNLSNAGEKLVLLDSNDLVVDWVDFTDDPPWPVTPDGLGASLERRCVSDNFDQPSDWIASLVGAPSPAGPTGSPIAPSRPRRRWSSTRSCIIPTPRCTTTSNSNSSRSTTTRMRPSISPTAAWRGYPIRLPRWLFDPRAAYRVISSDPPPAVPPAAGSTRYANLSDANTLGPFSPELRHGDARVWFLADDGRIVDGVSYGDDFPWPSSADGYGSVEGRGRSLQRRCPSADAASPVQLGRLGRRCSHPRPGQQQLFLDAAPHGDSPERHPVAGHRHDQPYHHRDDLPIHHRNRAAAPYFVDDPETTGETIYTVSMTDGGNGLYSATLPANRPTASFDIASC